MRLKNLEINGFKSFAQKTTLEFQHPVVAIVGPNGSGKSNVVEAFRFVLGEQSMKSMRGKQGLDLIFKGSKNLSKGTRAGVTVYFDNSDKIFKLSDDVGENLNLNFDTVSIGREVYSDGLNKYILNQSEVRLKDINNLLASVNIGSSGHHIISQGEADRILNASTKDRREMVEDALGLKIYQYKIKDAERKLERSNENMKEVTLKRRENAPHLNFLKKQVEKFEKAKEMKEELLLLYREYLKNESIYLDKEQAYLHGEKSRIEKELHEVAPKIKGSDDENSRAGGKKIEELKILEQKSNELRRLKGELDRKLGRIEGLLESKESRTSTRGNCPVCGKALEDVTAEQEEKRKHDERELEELKASREKTVAEMASLEAEEKDLAEKSEILKQEINKEMEALRDLERERFSFKVKHQELTSALELIAVKVENLRREEEAFQNEIKEGSVLIGPEILSYKLFEVVNAPERSVQEDQRKKIERLKIKLEDTGLGGNDIVKEYNEVVEHDNFLAKEMEDLAKSIESLQLLMVDLKEKINHEFNSGVKKINVEFQNFFALMFGGGSATLSVTEEKKRKREVDPDDESAYAEGYDETMDDTPPEKGVEINVSLPHKKVKELHALSGGERSLTSIALLFAMSQVNPPPFLVLDETDAALDEANSRKYGDMLEKLSKHSQLIVVTHNRETMSRAGVLYGVTVGSDGASKLLSVKFEEAQAIAK